MTLQHIIRNKYSDIFTIEDGYVHVVDSEDGVREYFKKERDLSKQSSLSNDLPTISMSINIKNVSQEICGEFLWDLAYRTISDKLKFNFESATSSSMHGSIMVDEFQAHHTIVTRAFQYLSQKPNEQTKDIGVYLVSWLPGHLNKLLQLDLEDKDKGMLTRTEKSEIVQNLYTLLTNEEVFRDHGSSVEQSLWWVDEMKDMQKWFIDAAVVHKLDKEWLDEVRRANPVRGYLKVWVRMVIDEFLRGRSWAVERAYNWIKEFIEAVSDEV